MCYFINETIITIMAFIPIHPAEAEEAKEDYFYFQPTFSGDVCAAVSTAKSELLGFDYCCCKLFSYR